MADISIFVLTRITLSTQSNSFPKLICFFYVETHKVSTSIRGGFHVLIHKTFLEQVHSARLSYTTDARPLTGYEKGLNVAENRAEYVLLTTWDGNSIFLSANRVRPVRKSYRWMDLRNGISIGITPVVGSIVEHFPRLIFLKVSWKTAISPDFVMFFN